MVGEDQDEQLPTGADPSASTLVSDRFAFRIEDRREYEYEREALEAMLFGAPPPRLEIGRYTVLERIGQGGMGTVYAAYDDKLDRKVAVKVLRAEAAGVDSRQRGRFLREAQVMAQLAHPNIVTVHEVGEYEGGEGVFIAMEFVRGTSLDRWLHPEARDGPRPWSEVVDVFVEAGRGLVAAHAAGIVHRDFKPHNVIRRDDGRVQVLDFGLASAAVGGAAPGPDSGSDPDSDSDPGEREAEAGDELRAARLTATGALLGTPAYMSPEQWRGEPTDARSDQFSFCAALYEGLYGELPFVGQTPVEFLDNVLAGRVRDPDRGAAKVPAWLERLVLRGLATDPDARHPSLARLLDQLQADPAVSRRRWLGGAALVAVVGAASVGLTLGLFAPDPAPVEAPCSGVEAALSSVFDDGRMARVEAALSATGLAYAEDTWARIEPRLRSYAQRWIDHGRRACEAHDDGRMSADLFDRATICLADGRNGLDALLDQLERADATVVEAAVEAVAKLPRLDVCLDVARLASSQPPLRDPAHAAEVADARAGIARARVGYQTGDLDGAGRLLDELLARAEALDEPTLIAEVELARGTLAQESWIADEAEPALDRALELGVGLGLTDLAVEASARRMFVRGPMQYRFAEARVDASYGAALLERSGDAGYLAWLYLNNAGALHQTRGEPERSRALYRDALAVVADAGDSMEAVYTRSNLAQLEAEQHRFAAGVAAQREVIAVAERLYGPAHPMTATMLYVLAKMLAEAGASAEARAVVGESLAIEEAARGLDDPVLAPQLALAADLANGRGRHAEAEALAERGLGLTPPGSFFGLELSHALADAKIGLGDHAGGLALHRETLARARELFAEQPSHLAWSNQGVALALLEAGAPAELDEARARAREALELRERHPGTTAVERGAALLVAAEVELARGDLDGAEALLARADATLADGVSPASPLHPKLARLDAELGARRQQNPRETQTTRNPSRHASDSRK